MRFGDQDDVEWIRRDTAPGVDITCAIPARFEDYATVLVSSVSTQREFESEAWWRLLRCTGAPDPWWFGFLLTGSHDGTPFVDPPLVRLYSNWSYALVAEDSSRAGKVRRTELWDRGPGPDLLFPADRSWLLSWLWDDEWMYVGGSTALIEAVLADPVLTATRVGVNQPDATPGGLTAR